MWLSDWSSDNNWRKFSYRKDGIYFSNYNSAARLRFETFNDIPCDAIRTQQRWLSDRGFHACRRTVLYQISVEDEREKRGENRRQAIVTEESQEPQRYLRFHPFPTAFIWKVEDLRGNTEIQRELFLSRLACRTGTWPKASYSWCRDLVRTASLWDFGLCDFKLKKSKSCNRKLNDVKVLKKNRKWLSHFLTTVIY